MRSAAAAAVHYNIAVRAAAAVRIFIIIFLQGRPTAAAEGSSRVPSVRRRPRLPGRELIIIRAADRRRRRTGSNGSCVLLSGSLFKNNNNNRFCGGRPPAGGCCGEGERRSVAWLSRTHNTIILYIIIYTPNTHTHTRYTFSNRAGDRVPVNENTRPADFNAAGTKSIILSSTVLLMILRSATKYRARQPPFSCQL